MGYESKLIIAELPVFDESGVPVSIYRADRSIFLPHVATVDLCKVGGQVQAVIQEAISAEKERLLTFPAGEEWRYSVYDGQECRVTDRYDDPVSPVDPVKLMGALAAAFAEDYPTPYRRYQVAIATLGAFLYHKDQWPFGFAVLHFGH